MVSAAGVSLFQPETRVVVTARARGVGPLDAPRLEPPPPDLSRAGLEELLSDAKYPNNLWLIGGEPTLHAQLPELLRGARRSRVGLVTDGLALAEERALTPLLTAGLSDVRIQLNAARLDAHDFMVQRKGAARRALAAVKNLKRHGVRCELTAKLSRVNATGLRDLVELAAELGIRNVRVERLSLPESERERAITLLLRLPLAEPELEAAATRASALGVQLHLHGFPHCFMGRSASLAEPADAVQLLIDASWPRSPWRGGSEAPLRCDTCSGTCEGAPSDYVARFGPTEFFATRNATSEAPSAQPREQARALDEVAPPPVRGARLPTVRLRVVQEQAQRKDLAGDPMPGSSDAKPEDVLRFGWRGAPPLACTDCNAIELPNEVETTRAIRQRLVRAAQYGARVLRVAGTDLLSHPGAAELLEELPRLGFASVVLGCVLGPGSSDESQIFPALAGLSWVDMALFGPDTKTHDAHVSTDGAFARTLHGAQQLSERGVAGGCFAVLHSASAVESFAAAWASGSLPGAPAFRLAEAGGSLDELSAALERLDQRARQALASQLPACLSQERNGAPVPTAVTFIERAERNRPVSSADRVGRFLPCQCGPEQSARCPGIAAGWSAQALEMQP